AAADSPHNPTMLRLFSKLSPVVSLCFLSGCVAADEQEVKLIQAIPRLETDLGSAYPDAAVQRYVANVGKRTARCAGRDDIPWDFKVLDSPLINAFAFPSGKIYITSGLLAKLENEPQLAGILGHEVAHVV